MITPFLLIPLAAVFQSGQQEPQLPQPERKVRIEIVTSENGETKRTTKEFDASNEEEMRDALRQMGVLEKMRLHDGERDITIDIRGFGDDDADDAMMLRMAPMAPAAPRAPGAPMAIACEPVAFLGVSTRNMEEADRKAQRSIVKQGATVLTVEEGSPAEKLGLKPNDIITELDGKAVQGPQGLMELVRKHKPGDEVKLVWLHEGRTMKEKVTLAERESNAFAFSFSDGDDEAHFEWDGDLGDAAELEELGRMGSWHSESRAFLGVTPTDDDDDADGVLIGSVEEGSAAARMGIRSGDRIVMIDGEELADFAQLAAVIRDKKPGDEVQVELEREGERMSVSGALGERKDHVFFRGQLFMDPEDREQFRRDMDQLRKEMDELRRELGHGLKREVRISIETRTLNDEEKALLRGKGVAVDNELQLEGLTAFPNPSNGFYRLQFEVPERGDLAVDVHNAQGERVYQERIVGFKGRYERTLDLSDLSSGSYYLVITQGGRTATTKLVKE
ncbi:MAG: PDZ domain-containing protein [Flavobacteriales bacterium]|nr:PDZ domain-containing protein [Flavobacteriales bacterium]